MQLGSLIRLVSRDFEILQSQEKTSWKGDVEMGWIFIFIIWWLVSAAIWSVLWYGGALLTHTMSDGWGIIAAIIAGFWPVWLSGLFSAIGKLFKKSN